MRGTISARVRGEFLSVRRTKETDHGKHKFKCEREERESAGTDGCGDCGEEFAEASVLSGLAGGKAEPRSAAALCRAVLPACGGVSEALAGAGGADGGSAARIDPRERSGGRKSGGAASEAVA